MNILFLFLFFIPNILNYFEQLKNGISIYLKDLYTFIYLIIYLYFFLADKNKYAYENNLDNFYNFKEDISESSDSIFSNVLFENFVKKRYDDFLRFHQGFNFFKNNIKNNELFKTINNSTGIVSPKRISRKLYEDVLENHDNYDDEYFDEYSDEFNNNTNNKQSFLETDKEYYDENGYDDYEDQEENYSEESFLEKNENMNNDYDYDYVDEDYSKDNEQNNSYEEDEYDGYDTNNESEENLLKANDNFSNEGNSAFSSKFLETDNNDHGIVDGESFLEKQPHDDYYDEYENEFDEYDPEYNEDSYDQSFLEKAGGSDEYEESSDEYNGEFNDEYNDDSNGDHYKDEDNEGYEGFVDFDEQMNEGEDSFDNHHLNQINKVRDVHSFIQTDVKYINKLIDEHRDMNDNVKKEGNELKKKSVFKKNQIDDEKLIDAIEDIPSQELEELIKDDAKESKLNEHMDPTLKDEDNMKSNTNNENLENEETNDMRENNNMGDVTLSEDITENSVEESLENPTSEEVVVGMSEEKDNILKNELEENTNQDEDIEDLDENLMDQGVNENTLLKDNEDINRHKLVHHMRRENNIYPHNHHAVSNKKEINKNTTNNGSNGILDNNKHGQNEIIANESQEDFNPPVVEAREIDTDNEKDINEKKSSGSISIISSLVIFFITYLYLMN
ncbi:rhoptry-associated membrane antigen, putative [Plasmodium relictum]|uniref:Rhoptry-associated membrane antigen, putative n=1 Tax=Plasmodium relictum TaxID=85471 RepID=A0A1J1H4P0_PLARL|nr:rhoptry-associated membrane antigen, putative [Plasmodium relictum]CRG98403.1 rhoptry-associated membrane antigen, putative [Plasmodium relictum]